MNIKEFERELNKKLNQYWQNKSRGNYPVHSNRASALGHDCIRYLVYERVAWDKKQLLKPAVLRVMEEGNLHERAVKKLLEEMGYDIVEQQRAFKWDKYQITGHIDGKIIKDGERVPIEIKSMSRAMFNIAQLEFEKEKIENKYLKKYLCQINLYMAMDNIEYGAFIFKNRDSGEIFCTGVELDYDLTETLIQKCETINSHVAEGTFPEGINDINVCVDCPYFHICNPHFGNIDEQLDLLEYKRMKRLEEVIDLRLELERKIADIQETIKELKQEEKELIGEREAILLKKYFIKGKWVELPERTIKATKYFRYWIKEK